MSDDSPMLLTVDAVTSETGRRITSLVNDIFSHIKQYITWFILYVLLLDLKHV